MRLLHTSDWHLGRLFHAVHLTMDQAYVLEQVVEIAHEAKVDAVVIAGDIYDRAVPPPQAVDLLDHVLSRLVLELGLPVIVIAGNHDSPHRMGFGSRLMAASKLHVVGPLSPAIAGVVLHDTHGPVHVYPVPYSEPAVVREVLGDPALESHDLAMRAVLAGIRARHPAETRSVLVAHAFVHGGTDSESERPLSIGGADRIPLDALEGFSYVALGHLHRPQTLGPRISYSGSLMKYSFSEAEGNRSISLVDLDAAGNVHLERVQLTPRRDVRRIRGLLSELLMAPGSDDYLEVVLTDRGPLLDPMGKLRERFPNALHLDREPFGVEPVAGPVRDHKSISQLELFEAFFQEATGNALSAEEQTALTRVMEQLSSRQRESTP